MIEVREIKNYDEFNSFLDMDKENLHVIKIGAEWCGPCRMMENVIKNLDVNKINNALFAEIDVDGDDTNDIVVNYSIRSIPVILFIKNGELLDKKVGSMSEDMLYKEIEKYK